MKLRPLQDRVIVKQSEAETKTASGIGVASVVKAPAHSFSLVTGTGVASVARTASKTLSQLRSRRPRGSC